MKNTLVIAALTILISLTSKTVFAAKECKVSKLGAKAMAELYILKNKTEIQSWVQISDLNDFAHEVAQSGEYSDEQNKYFFDIVTYANNGGLMHDSVWLEVSCYGASLNYQFID